MHRYLIRILLVLGGIASLFSPLKAVPIIDQGQLVVSGTWQPESIDADTTGKWVKLGDHRRITFPKNTAGEFGLICREPLPAGDWTADFWFAQYDDMIYADTTVILGKADSPEGPFSISIHPGDNRAEVSLQHGTRLLGGGGYVYSGGGRIHWLRLIYQAAAQQVSAYLNGEALRMDSHTVALPATPVIVRVKMSYASQREVTEDFAGYTVTPGAQLPSASVPGLAGHGWAGQPVALTPMATQALARLTTAPALTDYGRSYAYAAQIFAARAGAPPEQQPVWTSARTYLASLIEKDLNNAAPLLAVMSASAPPEQRAAIEALTGAFHTRLGKAAMDDMRVFSRLMAHTTLLDPGLAVTTAARSMQSHTISPAMIGDVAMANPNLALSAECLYLNNQNNDMAKLAWYLPELRAISPNYAQLVVESLQFSIGRKLFRVGEPDRSLSYAAWRLAPIDFSHAVAFCSGITIPEVKADTFQAVGDELEGRAIDGADEQIETGLLDAVIQFTPTQRNDAPGREIMRLVRWYESKGRHQRAMNALGQAKKHLSALPSTAFRDTYAIYGFLRDVKDPEAAAWLEKSVAAAITADQGRADYSRDAVYAGAIHIVVRDLARQGRIDDALAVAEKLNTPELTMNYSNALAAILYTVAETDLPRALALIDKMPDERQRKSSIGGLAKGLAARDPKTALVLLHKTQDNELLVSLTDALAPELAKEDPKATLALLEHVAPARRASTLIHICVALPQESPEFTALCGEAVKAKFAEYRARPSDGRDYLLMDLETLPLRTLIALQPYFSDEMDGYARVVCAATARESGVGNDPLWQRLSLADRPRYGQANYWGCTYLRDAVAQWKRDQGK